MEEGTITLHVFTRLVWPVGLVGIVIGIFSTAMGVRIALSLRSSEAAMRDSHGTIAGLRGSIIERVTVGICAVICLLGFVVAAQTIRLSRTSTPQVPLVSVLAAAALILTGLPAVLWETRFRWLAEGVALTALGCSAILGAWSIGVFLLPIVALVVWVCLEHLREQLHGGIRAPSSG